MRKLLLVTTATALGALAACTQTSGEDSTSSSTSSSSSSSSSTGGASSSNGGSSVAGSSSNGGSTSVAGSTSAPNSSQAGSSGVASSSSSAGGPVCDPEAPVCTPACNGTQQCNSTCTCVAIPPSVILPRPSSSRSIDISRDDTIVAAVNRDVGTSISIFSTATGIPRVSQVSGFVDARALVFHPDATTLFVADARGVTKVTGANTVTPAAGTVLSVCAEPQGVALSPGGTKLYVACLDGYVAIVTTMTMTLDQRVQLRGAAAATGGPLPANAAAMAIAVTNDGDMDESDETVVVPLFWYEPITVTVPADVDVGGQGVVALLSSAGVINDRINLQPEPDVSFGTGAFPNQLSSVTTQNGRAYILALAAAPKGAPGPAAGNPDAGILGVAGSQNTYPFLIALDLASKQETNRINFNRELFAKQGNAFPDRYLSVMGGLSFVPGTSIGYAVSLASDAVVRFKLNSTDDIDTTEVGTGGFGSRNNDFIATDKAPSGIIISHGVSFGFKGFVLNEVSRTLQVVRFSDQAIETTVASADPPAAASTEEKVNHGKRFFFTSLGRWGNNGMVGCLACHPGQGAWSDNVTWYFAAGPRQTVAMDAMFGKVGEMANGAPNPADQRALNWTAIFDEMHDFELNTRGVSAGVGAIVSDAALSNANRINLATANDGGPAQFLRGSTKAVVTAFSALKDWDEIDAFGLTLPTPAGSIAATRNQASVDRGRELFGNTPSASVPSPANCIQCHSGSKWTVSRVPYDSTNVTNGAFAAERARTVAYTGGPFNNDTTVIAGDDLSLTDGGVPTPALDRIACVLRNVGTFDRTSAFEVRQNMAAGNTAQGIRGFNPPSMLGVRYGAPYFHNGAAKTLANIFDPAFDAHTTAGNVNFIPTAQDKADLVAFLETIDDTTTVFPIPSGAVVCPASIP